LTKARDSTESRAFVVQTTRTTAGPRASFEHGNPRLAGVAGFAVRRSRGLAGGSGPAALAGSGPARPEKGRRGLRSSQSSLLRARILLQTSQGSCDFAWFSDRLW